MSGLIRVVFGRLSITGVVFALAFFCAALTPSLMPREAVVQGALCGVAAALGYLLGAMLSALWGFLEIPKLETDRRQTLLVVALLGLIAVGASLRHADVWQNSTLALWQQPPLDTVHPFQVVLVAGAVFTALVLVGRLFQVLFQMLAAHMAVVLPRRIALLGGLAAAILIFWSVGENLLLRGALRLADSSFKQLDNLLEDQIAAPSSPLRTGGPGSLLAWHGLGREGRNFIASGPDASEISAFWDRPALEPIRVYAGLNSAETIAERVQLALDELIRQGGFERSTLVIVTPTGTGWVDPAAMDTLEYLHRGDVASVALQYSYLTSWLSLLVEPEYGLDSARSLFRAVYDHWKNLPETERPKLVLYGLSLGALNSQNSADLLDIVADPFHGALWAGPPFQSAMWRDITANREPGSPAWLPRYQDGSVIRFTSQENHLGEATAPWGPLRIVYLQYASDPVVFFDLWSLYRPPEWLNGDRGPDVSPVLRWYPVLTMLQLLFDMMIATNSPLGHGHMYAPEHHIEPWIAVTGLDVDPETVERLKQHFAGTMRTP
ncbi:alpha/beta-hydrolase family protein [Peteryoungia desertarenae]|uniref:Alpha/beta-hydrolase family protein n=1 Tax=Peteryoungia desertarenae TaxID=1813451 RepID=A0ABX6QRQ9_9HYPH|nr:alpha/beta-hydrolase family protein [Peteryoungia desertarenae]